MPQIVPKTKPAPTRWTFMRKFRLGVYLVFIVVMVFFAFCSAAGIITNLRERYRDLDIPVHRPSSLSELGSLQLHDCLNALEQLKTEQLDKFQACFQGELNRDQLLKQWKEWSGDWQKRLGKLGISCRLTELGYEAHPMLGMLAGVYRHLEEINRIYSLEMRRFVTENSATLYELRQLLQDVHSQIDTSNGLSNQTPP